MGDEKPRAPFVTYHSDDTGNPDDHWSLRVGGVLVPTRFRPDPPDIGAEVEVAAEAIERAVEAREAKLRGTLQRAVSLLKPAIETSALALMLMDFMEAALDGTGPDYVPEDVANALAFDLGQAQETIRKLALIHDSLDLERAERIAPFLEAMGLRKPGPLHPSNFRVAQANGKTQALHEWARTNLADDELISEVRRRGMSVYNAATSTYHSPRLDPPLRVPASLPNLPSELRPGAVFGDPPIGSSPENPAFVLPGQTIQEATDRYLMPVPQTGQPQWRDAAGEWHDFDGRNVPQEAVQLRTVYRGGGTGITR